MKQQHTTHHSTWYPNLSAQTPAMQDHGYVLKMEDFYQAPANNIIRLAAWDSRALLGIWDLDEFLVLPKKKAWSDLSTSGCLGTMLAQEQEATLPVSWAIIPSNGSPDIEVLAKHGTVMNALLQLPIKHIPYTDCKFRCKTVIVPSAPWTFNNHGSTLRHGAAPVPCESGRLLHFTSMWYTRTPWHNNGVAQPFNSTLYDIHTCDGG
jgi:hypothetical protein